MESARFSSHGNLHGTRCTYQILWWKRTCTIRKIFEIDSGFRTQTYLELVAGCKEDENFSCWQSCDAAGKTASPIELLVLGVLRYLGRGWTCDDLEELTAISREVHCVFFHAFIAYGSTDLYEKFVCAPIIFEDAKRHMNEFAEAGFAGDVGSSDCTHVISEKVEYSKKNNHLGGKRSQTTRTFSLTVNHRRRILHSPKGGPGRWNDKTMIHFAQFVSGIRDDEVLEDVEFKLLEWDRMGNVVTAKYRGG